MHDLAHVRSEDCLADSLTKHSAKPDVRHQPCKEFPGQRLICLMTMFPTYGKSRVEIAFVFPDYDGPIRDEKGKAPLYPRTSGSTTPQPRQRTTLSDLMEQDSTMTRRCEMLQWSPLGDHCSLSSGLRSPIVNTSRAYPSFKIQQAACGSRHNAAEVWDETTGT